MKQKPSNLSLERLKKRIIFVLIAVIALSFLLVGCIWPRDTTTLKIRNEMTGGKTITALYLYEPGATSKGASLISATLYPNENHFEYGVQPGEYLLEAEVDGGAGLAIINIIAEENLYKVVRIYDSDLEQIFKKHKIGSSKYSDTLLTNIFEQAPSDCI